MQPFQVDWNESDVNALLQQVKAYKLPTIAEASGWAMGCDPVFIKQLQDYWLNHYDWQAAVESLNRYPQFISTIDGIDIHFVHVVGEAKGKRPLLITHGWPGSHFEFWNIIEPLAYPSRFGGNTEDAFDLIIPSLPGFGFSGKPQQPISQRETAGLWNRLMTETLGYSRYRAQGGDFGSIVSSWLALDYSEQLIAIHLNMLPLRSMAAPQNDAEGQWMQQAGEAQQHFGTYSLLHMGKPLSLILATANNPLGQASWIIERFHDWSDLTACRFEDLYSFDELLTNIMIYLMTNSFASAVMYYPGIVKDGYCFLPENQRIETSTAYAAFPSDAVLPCPPRSRAELCYNISRWTAPPAGGHFAAMEQPDWLVNDIREWAAQD